MFKKKNGLKFYDVNGTTHKIGEIAKTNDGRIIYYVDLEDTEFLRWLYEYKDNEFIKKDSGGIEQLLFYLEQSAGLFPKLLTDCKDFEKYEDIKKIREQVKQLLKD